VVTGAAGSANHRSVTTEPTRREGDDGYHPQWDTADVGFYCSCSALERDGRQ